MDLRHAFEYSAFVFRFLIAL